MESYLEENFGGVKGKNSSEEALRRWRKLCSVVKNPKRRFRFTANLDKRGEAQAIKHANHDLRRFWDLEAGARSAWLPRPELVGIHAGRPHPRPRFGFEY